MCSEGRNVKVKGGKLEYDSRVKKHSDQPPHGEEPNTGIGGFRILKLASRNKKRVDTMMYWCIS